MLYYSLAGLNPLNNPFPLNLTLIAVVVVLTAIVTYFVTAQFSSPTEQHVSKELTNTQTPAPAIKTRESTEQLGPVNVLLVNLKQRLETQKDDVDGWILLSKSYHHLNRLKEAEEAFEQALALGYAGNWKPVPRIDSFIQDNYSSQNLKSMINFQNHNVDENSSQ